MISHPAVRHESPGLRIAVERTSHLLLEIRSERLQEYDVTLEGLMGDVHAEV
jgi:hypothetical protein